MHLIITANLNKDGLAAACGQAAYEGISGAGGEAEIIDISAALLKPCLICNNGWGHCKDTHKCIINDILSDLQEKIREAESVIIVSPVYFGQPSERMKYFFDRFRRCEAIRKDGVANGKYIDLIAVAGGSGHGTATCLAEMETWCRHVGGIPKERIGVTKYNRTAMLEVIRDSGERFIKGEYFNQVKK